MQNLFSSSQKSTEHAWESGFEDEIEEYPAGPPRAQFRQPTCPPSGFNSLQELLHLPQQACSPAHLPYVANMSLSAAERKKLKDTYRKRLHCREQCQLLQQETGTTLKEVAWKRVGAVKDSPVLVHFKPPLQCRGWTGAKASPRPAILSVPNALRISGLSMVASDPRYVLPSFTEPLIH